MYDYHNHSIFYGFWQEVRGAKAVSDIRLLRIGILVKSLFDRRFFLFYARVMYLTHAYA